MTIGLIDREIQSALDALLKGRDGGVVTRSRLESEMKRLAQRVENRAKNELLVSLRSTEQVAELYGVSRQSINTRATRIREKRVASDFGWLAGRGVWVFTPDEVEELRPGKPGRPPANT